MKVIEKKQFSTNHLKRNSFGLKTAPIPDKKSLTAFPTRHPLIQPKLKIGQPNDKYELEAHRVADQVIRIPEPKQSLVNGHWSLVQKKSTYPECMVEEREEIPRTKQTHNQTQGVNCNIESGLDSIRGDSQSLPETVRSFFEPRFGHDFSQVRVHTNEKAAHAAKLMNARAFTLGKDITFGLGQYSPGSAVGKRLLAHELTHVVQQNARGITSGQAGGISTHGPGHMLQLDDKKKPELGGETERGFTQKPEDIKNKFSFTANLKVPLSLGLSPGPFIFFDDLKITTVVGKESEEPISISATDISLIQSKIALTLIKLESMKWALPQDIGEMSLGATLGSSGALTWNLGSEGGLSGALGTTLSLESGFKTRSLLPSSYGKLTLGTTLGATGSLEQTLGKEEEFTPKLSWKSTLGAEYQSPVSRSPFATLGGLLGEEASLSLRPQVGLSGSFAPETGLNSKISAGGTFGLVGKTEGKESAFIKVKISGDVGVDLNTGQVDSTSQSLYGGLTTGFKFSIF